MVKVFKRLFRSKKAQAGAAAVLLAIIAMSLVMFVVLLNPDDRDALLGEYSELESSLERADEDDGVLKELLLEEFPGRIDYLQYDEIEHSLPSVFIYTEESSEILYEKSVITVKNGLFSEETSTFDFRIESVSLTEDLLLSFAVEELSGTLLISFNGENIYSGSPEDGATPIITIPNSLLLSNNEVEFSVSSPGISFWRTHYATLANIKVVADVTDTSFQEATSTFLLSDTEYANLENLELRFQPECDFASVGRLHVSVNGREVYAGVPDCGLEFVPIEFSKELTYEGENTVHFSTESGQYSLLHVRVISELEDIVYPTYYFDLTLEEFENVEEFDDLVKVVIEFTNDDELKTGYININGDKEHFDTRELSETIDISGEVVAGNNALELVPTRTIEVRELLVELRD